MTIRAIPLLFLGLSLLSCADTKVKGPDFSVNVELSDSARIKLNEMAEKLIVHVWFDGDGEKLSEEYNAPYRDVYLGAVSQEVELGEVAHFKGVQFSADDFQRLDSENYHFTINVVSARKTYKNNLLSCDVPMGFTSDLSGKTINVKCPLIRE